MHQQHGARGFSFQLEEASPKPPELGRLDLDWSDLAAGSPPEPGAGESNPAPRAQPALESATAGALQRETPLMPHAAADRRPEPRSLLSAFAPAEAPVAAPSIAPPAESAPLARVHREADAAPVVRRLRFPAPSQSPVGSSAELTPSARKASPRPSTRFAESIGQSRRLADSADVALTDAPPPEDLPGAHADGWPDESAAQPEPAELLRRAQVLWSTATKTASDLGGRGLESGRLLAGQMSDALRERFESAAAQRAAPAPSPDAAPQRSATSEERAAPAAGRGPRRLPFTMSKKSAGPVLALVAALGMFIASRQLLGVGVSLSKTAPSIPDLGEVAEKGPAPRTAAPDGVPATPKSTAPPPMATEIVPLPAGLAWPGKGLLEVVTSEDELVYVDGVFTGRGPLRRVPVAPGEHEVSIRKEGSERRGTANVELGRTTRAIFRGK